MALTDQTPQPLKSSAGAGYRRAGRGEGGRISKELRECHGLVPRCLMLFSGRHNQHQRPRHKAVALKNTAMYVGCDLKSATSRSASEEPALARRTTHADLETANHGRPLRIRRRQRVNWNSARDRRRRNYRGGRRQGWSARRRQTACTLRLHSRQLALQRECRRRRKVLRRMLQVMSRRQRHAGNIGLAARGGGQQQAQDGMTQNQPLAQCFHGPLFLCQVVRQYPSLRRPRRPVKRDKLREAGESRPPGSSSSCPVKLCEPVVLPLESIGKTPG
jgi:hypothetical protein